MRYIEFNLNGTKDNYTQSHKESLSVLKEIKKEHLSYYLESKNITSDMDGVMIYDDNALTSVRLTGGNEAQEYFSKVADLNIKVAEKSDVPYCWYAPTVFGAQLLSGLNPDINRVIGQNMRLIPGAELFYNFLNQNGYAVTSLTAGHQEAAEEVSKRLEIKNTIGTQLEIINGLYTSQIESFIGGHCKSAMAQKVLRKDNKIYGVHIGDSWSDVETLRDIPSSIAYNPGCQEALNNATISVITSSINSLSPLFNSEISDTTIPELVIINPFKLELPEEILELSKTIKKQTLKTLVEISQGEDRIDKIKEELQQREINFKTDKIFMSLEHFDTYAKNMWQSYKERNGI